MAWQDPMTRATGDKITAAIWNTDLVDNLIALAGVSGRVNSDGVIDAGTGFTVSKTGTGTYTVTFSTAFAAAPVVSIRTIGIGANRALAFAPVATTTTLSVETTNLVGTDQDQGFEFWARQVI